MKYYLVSEDELRYLKYRAATIPNSRTIEEEFKDFLKSKQPVEVIGEIDRHFGKKGKLIFIEDKE